jgi:hypothetical protein
MRTYVRDPGSDLWHWCLNCSGYPSQPVDALRLPLWQRPRGEHCDECVAKQRDEDCCFAPALDHS